MDDFGSELDDWFGREDANVGNRERVASVLGGGALILAAVAKRGFWGALLLVAGSGLIYRGATGYCPLCERLNEDGA